MKIVFFGTSEFARISLEYLLGAGFKIDAVVTRPDVKSGRALKLSENPVKIFSKNNRLKTFQFDKLDNEALLELKKINPDLFVVVSYGKILNKDFLAVPKFYSINLHASLLPKYRGAAPINWAVINGDKLTGATIIRLNTLMDEGDIMSKAEIAIDDLDTSITLSKKIAEIGGKLLVKTCALIQEGSEIRFIKQDSAKVSYAPKLKKNDGLINWNDDALKIHNLSRGLLPWPSAFTYYGGKLFKIFKTKVFSDSGTGSPGEILSATSAGILVKCGNGAIFAEEVQVEGKKKMPVKDFLVGHNVQLGIKLGK